MLLGELAPSVAPHRHRVLGFKLFWVILALRQTNRLVLSRGSVGRMGGRLAVAHRRLRLLNDRSYHARRGSADSWALLRLGAACSRLVALRKVRVLVRSLKISRCSQWSPRKVNAAAQDRMIAIDLRGQHL